MIRVCEKLLTPAENIPGRGGSANRSLGNGSSASIFQTIDFEKNRVSLFPKAAIKIDHFVVAIILSGAFFVENYRKQIIN